MWNAGVKHSRSLWRINLQEMYSSERLNRAAYLAQYKSSVTRAVPIQSRSLVFSHSDLWFYNRDGDHQEFPCFCFWKVFLQNDPATLDIGESLPFVENHPGGTIGFGNIDNIEYDNCARTLSHHLMRWGRPFPWRWVACWTDQPRPMKRNDGFRCWLDKEAKFNEVLSPVTGLSSGRLEYLLI